MSKHSERVTKQLISMQQEVLALRKENRRLKLYLDYEQSNISFEDLKIQEAIIDNSYQYEQK